MSHTKLLALCIVVLAGADLVLASAGTWNVVFLGVGFWVLHRDRTQGLLATMVADTAPPDLRVQEELLGVSAGDASAGFSRAPPLPWTAAE